MKVSCPKCRQTYEIDDFGVTPGMSATCQMCGAVFPVVAPKVGTLTRAPVAPAATPRPEIGTDVPRPAPSPLRPRPHAKEEAPTPDPLDFFAKPGTAPKKRLGPEMIHCPDCGEPVSRGALSCPHCGLLWFSKGFAAWFLGGLVVSVIMFTAGAAMAGMPGTGMEGLGDALVVAGLVLNLIVWVSAIGRVIRTHGR